MQKMFFYFIFFTKKVFYLKFLLSLSLSVYLFSFLFFYSLSPYLLLSSSPRSVSNKVVSPMVFLGRDFWTRDMPVYPLVTALAKGKEYEDAIRLCDDWKEALEFLQSHPPRPCPGGQPCAAPNAPVAPQPGVATISESEVRVCVGGGGKAEKKGRNCGM